jgi:hypothetical protein
MRVFTCITLFERPQKRPFRIENGLSEVAKDRLKHLKFSPQNNNLANCAQVVLLVGFLLSPSEASLRIAPSSL